MWWILESIADNLEIEVKQLPLVILAVIAIVALGLVGWYLYWSWLVNFFSGR